LVRYIDYHEDRLPTMNLFEFITHKNICWPFECEVRAVMLHPPSGTVGFKHFQENHFESETKKGFKIYAPQIDISQLIKRVVFHPEATQDFKNEITRLCEKNDLPKPIQSAFQGAL